VEDETVIAWEQGEWLNPPQSASGDGGHLIVLADGETDFWRTTSYGFVHDNGHALLQPWTAEASVEVAFMVDFDQQFDQAGLLIRRDPTTWIKAGVEISDGALQVGAVVTHDRSDWSVAPVPEWQGREVRMRASWSGDAVTVRARSADGPWRLVRVAPWPVGAVTRAGPYCCAPTRGGLRVTFIRWSTGPADTVLHP
jgi:regulation of enolase protein 1 (concanavalin A-like superfamily)